MGCINMSGLRSLLRRRPGAKLQAASCKQQATSFKLRQSVIYASGTGMVIWSRAARELVSTIRSKPCEACIRGEAGGSSQQQKGKICQDLHLSLTTKNSKWRTRSTSTVYRTTRWAQPTIISTFLKELGLVHVTAAQPIPGSGTEETSSINITAPVQLGPSSYIPSRSHKLQASSAKLLKVQAASFKRRAASFKLQAASGKLQDLVSFIKIREARSEGLY
jgi:hypothetical protein